MKAVRIHNYGGPEVLQYEEAEIPKIKANEVLVKIKAAGINFIDIYMRKGLYKTNLPAVLGMEGAGIIEDLGMDVSDFQKGERVAYTGIMGGYAEYAAVPAENLVKIPDGIGFSHAASLMLQGMTAHYLSHDAYPLKKNDTALIHAAAGGVGLLLVQMAKLRGAKVIGTVSTKEKGELARSFGADELIIYTEKDFEEEVNRITKNNGVNAVYDSVGKDTFEKGLRLLKKKGYMILYGQSSGPVAPVDLSLGIKGSVFLTRPSLMDYTATREELLERANDVFNMAISGKLKLRIEHEFRLKDAAKAHSLLESRKSAGKLLLVP